MLMYSLLTLLETLLGINTMISNASQILIYMAPKLVSINKQYKFKLIFICANIVEQKDFGAA